MRNPLHSVLRQPALPADGRGARILRIALAALLLATPAAAQVLGFRSYTAQQGLPQAQILAIHQDSRQYLWVGTYAGLSRFNGDEFRTYGVEHGLAANPITTIAEDAAGRIIVGSIGGGVCILDGDAIRCLRDADGLPHNDVLDVQIDPDGRTVWVATHRGVARIANGQVQAFGPDDGIPDVPVYRLARDNRNTLLVGGDHGLARWDGARFVPMYREELGGASVHMILDTPWGLMLGASGRLYLARDGTLDLLRVPGLPRSGMITDADLDAAGAVWISTRAGVLYYDGEKFDRYTTENGILFDQVNRVRVDREGSVWFGTERGLSRLTPGPFRHYTQREGLPNSFVRAISADRGGRIWLGTRDGVAVREGDSFRPLALGAEVVDRRVFSLAPLPDGSMLIGTRGGLVHHDGTRTLRLYGTADGLPNAAILSMVPDGEGGAWIGTAGGLAHWSGGRIMHVTGPAALDDLFIVSMELDRAGRLWLGARSGGVVIYDGDSATVIGAGQGLSDQTVWSIASGPGGAIWVGTNGDGVFRVDPSDLSAIRRLTKDEGLIDNFVWQVQPDGEGAVWLYTNRGIDRVADDGIRHYGRGRGLLELEGAANASWRDEDGDLWFGTSVSVVRYTPQLDTPAPLLPPIIIEVITIGTDTVPAEGARLRSGGGILKIRFASPTFRDESGVRFRYRLIGASEEWSEPTAERSIGYASLAPGSYEFQVYAIDADGGLSPQPASFAVVIAPRFWETWWFRVMGAALVLATGGGIVVARTRGLEAERRRLAVIVAERTGELSLKNDDLEREIAERQRAEQALRASQQKISDVIDSSTNMFYSHDPDGVITYVSPQSRQMLGCEPEEAMRHYHEFVTANPINQLAVAATQRAIETGEKQAPFSMELIGKDGIKRWVEVIEAPVVRDGRTIAIVGSLTDVTEAKRAASEHERLEAQLRQAQKMEAVGRLAGGIAHDFNNLLTAVVGNTEMVAGGLEPDHPLQMELTQVRNAADRAAALVSQLLAFSRQQLIRRRVLDLNTVVTESARMLRRMIGTDVELQLELAPGALHIEADESQLDQVLINLALNARDAMPSGGRLVISTKPVELSRSLLEGLDDDLAPGPYVALRVSDNGHGMDAETTRHVFEPFFTTKGVGMGTGLGLATVYGIVTQNGGAVRIDSQVGKGTTFHLFLPRVASALAEPEPGAAEPPPERTTVGSAAGVVLVVEDEDSVRLLVRRTLERFGFHVLPAENGAVALTLCEEFEGAIDLLLTDMVMPGLNGREVAERVTTLRPETRVLYMSGHTREVLGSRFMLDEATQVVQKPFSPTDLVQRVRESLSASMAG